MNNLDFDFGVILSVLTLFTGLFWALDKWWLSKRREGGQPPNGFIDFCRSFFPVIFFVLMLRSFLVEPFRIPSGSMIPTLLVGDFILVNKYEYGLRDPLTHTKFFKLGEPQRGDVVVFRWPVDPSKDFIKRIVGIPGDHIAYRNKQLFINDEPAPISPAGVYPVPGRNAMVYRMEEQLSGVDHHILINPARSPDDFDFTVPEGQYFAMGDNRDGSDDSRYWGTVPEANLVGKAFLIWMSWDGADKRIDFSRIGDLIH